MIEPRQEAIDVVELVDAGQLIRINEAQRNRRHGSTDDVHDPLAGLITGRWWWRRRRLLLQTRPADHGLLLLYPHRSANRDCRDRSLAGGNDRNRGLHCLYRLWVGQDGLCGAGPCRGALLAAVANQLQVPRRRPGVGRRAAGWAVPAAVGRGGPRRRELLLERAVPVVLDGEVCPPRELGSYDGPAVRRNW